MIGFELPIIVGLIAVGAAILERGYKTFLEKRKEDPELKFDGAYLLNILVSTGTSVTIVTGVLPAVITELTGQSTVPVTIGSILLNFVLGYAVTYRILDALNNSTSNKIAIANQ